MPDVREAEDRARALRAKLQPNSKHDMDNGPCACGAWHHDAWETDYLDLAEFARRLAKGLERSLGHVACCRMTPERDVLAEALKRGLLEGEEVKDMPPEAYEELEKALKGEGECPNGLLPDGPTCPRCGGKRAPSGVDGGSWVHFEAEGE